MELLQLRYFCHAAVTENFSETARAFRVPPSNISQSVKRLEEELGLRLFNRVGNRVVLNPRGRVFYEDVSQALDLLERAGRSAGDVAERQEIRLGVQLLSGLNRDFAARCRTQFPDVDIRSSRFTQDSDPADYDLIVADGSVSTDAFSRHQIRHDKIYLVAARGVLPEDGPVTAELLREMTFISHPAGSVAYKNTQEICGRLGFCPKILTSEGHSHYFIPRSVEQGLGVALVTRRTRWVTFIEDALDIRDIGEFYRDAYVYRTRDPRFRTRQTEEIYHLLLGMLNG